MIDTDALEAPFDIEEIKQRPLVVKKDNTAALPANYIDARSVSRRLDKVVGPLNWQRDHKEIKGVIYAGIGIYNETADSWVWKWDSGAESNMEKEKGEASDSFKRAAVNWGIGRFLYELPNIWVDGNTKSGKFRFDKADLKAYRKQLADYLNGKEIQSAPEPHNKRSAYDKEIAYVKKIVQSDVFPDNERSEIENVVTSTEKTTAGWKQWIDRIEQEKQDREAVLDDEVST